MGIQHCSGQRYGHSIDIASGYVQDGFGIYGGYNYYLSETGFIKSNAGVSFSKQSSDLASVNFNIYQINSQYLKEIYATRRAGFTVYFGGGVLFGYEAVSVKSNKGFEANQNSNFLYGPIVTVELDIFLTRKSSFVVEINEQWQINSDVGNFIPFIGIGYRYTLN